MRLPGASQHRGFEWSDAGTFCRIFAEALSSLEKEGVPHVLLGGLASAALGRPRCSTDIDLLVRPVDAGRALDALASAGFATEETNPHWLYKGTKEGVLVDLLFKARGDIYLDDLMLDRSTRHHFMGQHVRVIPPEDLIVIKALAHDEETSRHWFDALSVIAAGHLDWDYLVMRSRKGPRRLLSLLLYATSIDLVVPARAVGALYALLDGRGRV